MGATFFYFREMDDVVREKANRARTLAPAVCGGHRLQPFNLLAAEYHRPVVVLSTVRG